MRRIRILILDTIPGRTYIGQVPLTEGVSGDEPELERDAASCGLARNHTPGRRPGNTALPPLRAGRANAPMRTDGHRSCATPNGFAKAGSGPINAGVERREASVPRMRGLRELVREGTRGARERVHARLQRTMAPAGLRHWPAKGASQAPERLSALRFPAFRGGGTTSKARGRIPSRERAVMPWPSAARSPKSMNSSCGV